jgi:hypothetical protein
MPAPASSRAMAAPIAPAPMMEKLNLFMVISSQRVVCDESSMAIAIL